jgi:hypothetical protein
MAKSASTVKRTTKSRDSEYIYVVVLPPEVTRPINQRLRALDKELRARAKLIRAGKLPLPPLPPLTRFPDAA